MAEGNNATPEDNAGGDLMSGLADAMGGVVEGITSGIAGGPIGIAITAISKIGESIMEMMTKVMQAIIDSSPFLQGVLKIITKMFNLVLMPIGNMIAKLLLPLAITMAYKTIGMLEKFSNSGPQDMADAATESFSIITESIIAMAATVLIRALIPIAIGMVNGIVRGLFYVLGRNTSGMTKGLVDPTEELRYLLKGSAEGTATVLDQFGLTVTTGNKAVRSSTSSLATVMYSGASSIADGFQSSTTALAVGSTDALKYLDDYNIANKGMLTEIDTATKSFKLLNEQLSAYKTTTLTVPTITPDQPPTTTTKSGGNGGDWWKWIPLIGPVLGPAVLIAKALGLGQTNTASSKSSDTGTTNPALSKMRRNAPRATTVNFYGNVYDKADITSIVNQSTVSNLKGAY